MTIERALVLSTGDELTSGRTLDTNAHYLADRLYSTGIDVVALLAVGDDRERIAWAWREGMRQADLVVSTGGLGPTVDDLTTETVASVTGRKLVFHPEVAEHIRALFAAMKREMPENNLKQAYFPEGAVVLPNRLGTAPGFRLEVEAEGGTRHLVVLPGVPREMKPMFEEQVLPWLESLRGTAERFVSRTFQTFGLSESALDARVAACVSPEEARVSLRAAFPKIALRLTVRGTPKEAEAKLEELAHRVREHLGEFVYAEGELSMEEVVGDLLRKHHRTLAVAESCTGGLVGHRLTEVPGSSEYFLGGIVAYANRVKTEALGVRPETLERHGAVSEETAREMAEGVRRRLGADIGLATTGIAGPTGGTPEKPVGTVCVALATEGDTFSRRYQLWGTRDWIKLLTSQIALDWVRRHLLGWDPRGSGFVRS
ncbi:MAG: competence/damage-inducible protein A [Candidatus Binatia bacterium]|nr:MAG: competence/damage-inducible protein A [Candidatus Binatia bacterium]